MFDFNIKENSITLSVLKNYNLNIKFCNNRYVFFVKGIILNSILFLYEFDRYFNKETTFF